MEFQYVRVQSNHISSSSSKALRRRSKLIFPTRPPPPPPEPPPEAAFSNMPINACSLTLCTRPACAARRMLSSSARAFSGFTMAILLTATEREERRSDAFGQSSVVYFALTRARRERRRSRRSRDEYARLSRAAGSKTLATPRLVARCCLSLAAPVPPRSTPSSGCPTARRDDRRRVVIVVILVSLASSRVASPRASTSTFIGQVNSTPSSPLARLFARAARRSPSNARLPLHVHVVARASPSTPRARARRRGRALPPPFRRARHVARGCVARRVRSRGTTLAFFSSSSRPRARHAARASTGRDDGGTISR